MKMDPNVGALDQKIRLGVGVLLIVLALAGVVGAWGFVIGAIAAATGFLKFCPAYRLIGMNTCQTQ